MKGQIKAGEGSLIGNAGEHYVVAELLKRRVIAALTPRNTPGYDILATRGDATVRIRVKTKSSGYDEWQWVVKKDGSIFRNLSSKNDFIILVNLTPETKDMEYFIHATTDVERWITKGFNDWVATPGKNGRPHNPSNTKRHLSYTKSRKLLSSDWELLWK